MPGKRLIHTTVAPNSKREWKAVTLHMKLEVLRPFKKSEIAQIAKALGPVASEWP